MRRAFISLLSLTSFALASAPLVARAQANDTVGTRAQGMAGAFTAVADDGTATWWNPAGLASGAYFNGIIEGGTHHEPGSDRNAAGAPVPAWSSSDRAVSLAFPSLGLSYYRLQVSQIRPQNSTGTAAGDRQDEGSAGTRLRTLTLDQFGASVGQSLGQHVVVGSTLKLLSGRFGTSVRPPGTGSLDEADELEIDGDTLGDLDIGAMAHVGHIRLGLMVRNVREPEFQNGLEIVKLSRNARAGFAFSSGTGGVLGQLIVAVDADLMKTTNVFGDQRRVAVGGEVWTATRLIGVRGGVSGNTIGDRRLSPSGGVSAAFRRGMYVDAEVTGGSEEGRHGWGIALRVTF